jgi:hypothetical protein
MTPQKTLILNGILLLGVSAIFFQGLLPVLDEIQAQNQQLEQLAHQVQTLNAQPAGKNTPSSRQLYALPETEQKHWSQELEQLALQQDVHLIALETQSDQAETFSKWHLKSTPYVFGIESSDPQKIAKFWAALDRSFPELMIQRVHYQKEVATVEARLLTSSESVRLFTPGN